MTPQNITKTLLAALLLTSAGQASPALRTQLAKKEKDLAAIQAEIKELKNRLNSGTSTITNGYTVKAGDTLSSIARQHRVSPVSLIQLNNLTDPSKITVGQTLAIKATQKSAPVATTGSYVVKKGDTFYSIARRHKMTVSSLQALNPDVTVSRIARGQKLVINGTPKAANTAVASTSKKKKSLGDAQLISNKTSKPTTTSKTKTQKKKESEKKPAPIPNPVIKKGEKPTPPPAPQVAPPAIEEELPTPGGVSAIILTDETTFEEFATKHDTTPSKLNEINGWNLPKSTTLARGSEIYIPK